MKIILCYPNFKWIKTWSERTLWKILPYSLCMLSAMVDKKYDVRIIDANTDDITKEGFSKIIEEENPNILGISILSSEYEETGFVAAEIAKKVNKKIKTIMGGVHATVMPESVILNENIDFVMVGEGEYVFKELCDYLNGEGSFPKRGLLYRKNGKVIDTGKADLIIDLDKLPYPSYHKVDLMKYATMVQREAIERPRDIPYTHILTSRGCPYGCNFCEVEFISGRKVRLRSVKNILGEIEWLIKTYSIRCLIFDDDNLLLDKKRAKDLFKAMINKGYNLKWTVPALAVYLLDDEMITLMKQSGCEYVAISIESGVKRVLRDIVGKPVDLDYAKKMVKILKENGIETAANFIIGFPGETWDEIRQTIKFAEELDVDYVRINAATPLPKTKLYNLAKEKGYLVEGFDFRKPLWGKGWIETNEFRALDLKILVAYEWDRINFTKPEKKAKIARMMGISIERLDEIRKKTLKSIKLES